MIHVINRHCKFSNLSANKPRPAYFSREKCLINLWKTSRHHQVQGTINFHYLFDGDLTDHFLLKHKQQNRIINFNAGTGAKSFLFALDYAMKVVTNPEDIIYFLEDDYLHKPNWPFILEEGIQLDPNGYVSLYDHPDKYPGSEEYTSMYTNLVSSILVSNSLHWRTVYSTTDTFAITKKNLEKNIDIFKLFSTYAPHSMDHDRGLYLTKNNLLTLRTCMPGYSTHMESAYMSPLIDWETIQKENQ